MGKTRAEIHKAYRERLKAKNNEQYLAKERKRRKESYIPSSQLSRWDRLRRNIKNNETLNDIERERKSSKQNRTIGLVTWKPVDMTVSNHKVLFWSGWHFQTRRKDHGKEYNELLQWKQGSLRKSRKSSVTCKENTRLYWNVLREKEKVFPQHPRFVNRVRLLRILQNVRLLFRWKKWGSLTNKRAKYASNCCWVTLL